MMTTAVRMSNTTSDSLTIELSRTVVPCALKNNSWLIYNSVYCMRRVRNCHKVCSLFGTGSALHLFTSLFYYAVLLIPSRIVCVKCLITYPYTFILGTVLDSKDIPHEEKAYG